MRLLIRFLHLGFVYRLPDRDWIYLDRLFESFTVLASDLIDNRHYLFELWSVLDADNGVHSRVDWVFKNEGGEQIGQVLVLLVREANLDVKNVEPDNSVMHQSHKAFHFLHDFIEQLFILR